MRLSAQPIVSLSAMEGSVSGHHKSPHRGSSVEFAEYRNYAPGDDIRRLDWRVFARTDRFYLKEFEAETNLWRMISKVVSERERFVIRSVRERLERAQNLLASGRDAATRGRRARIGQLLSVAQTAETVVEKFVQSQRADFSMFTELLAIPLKRP